jgi:hypothetical protein
VPVSSIAVPSEVSFAEAIIGVAAAGACTSRLRMLPAAP